MTVGDLVVPPIPARARYNINLRDKPGGRVVGVIKKDSVVGIDGTPDVVGLSGWWPVRCSADCLVDPKETGEETGWVYSELLEKLPALAISAENR